MQAEARVAELVRRGRVGVIDIGSNSLRLVVYDGLGRAPLALFNEKVLCGLGRGLAATGRLNPDGVAQAHENLQRFVALAHAIGVARLDVLATAAVREAVDGPDFVAEAERRCRISIRVLSGADEARLAALGVVAGIPDAKGVVGDLGGGSVELVAVEGRRSRHGTTLPIGPLRFAGDEETGKRSREIVDAAIAGVDWLRHMRGETFYPVGGAWRALARIHMEHAGYPLHVIQHYALPRGEAETFLQIVSRQSRKSLEKISSVSRKRLETVPFAAHILARLVRAAAPRRLVFSAWGVREGHLFDLLPEAERGEDPLLTACEAIAASHRRFGADGRELFAWTSPLFTEESAPRRRLRLAIALVSDIAWTEHPDYRADHAFERVLRLQTGGVEHDERVFMAAAIHARYGGVPEGSIRQIVRRVLDEEAAASARSIGLALRLAYTMSGGVPHVLSRTTLSRGKDGLELGIPSDGVLFVGEAVQRRLDGLARHLGLKPMVVPAAERTQRRG